MTLNEIKEIVEAVVLTNNFDMNIQVDKGCSSDLMSDVLAFSKPGSLLITGLTNETVVRSSEFANMKVILFVRGKKPNAKTIALAEEKKIPMLATKLSMFEACGRLYMKGLGADDQF
jgi:predicted transcriptional regulator